MSRSPLLSARSGRLKAERRGRLLLRAAVRLFAGFSAGYALASLLAWPLPGDLKPLIFAALLILGLAAGFWTAAVALRKGGFNLSDEEAATILAAGSEELANVLVAGADLSKWEEEGARRRQASEHLVAQGISEADRALQNLPKVSAGPGLQGDARLLALGLALMLSAYFLTPGGTGETVARVIGGYSGKPVALGNLVITYRPPAHTGLPVTREEGSLGDIKAYAGTLVELQGVLSEPVDGGELTGPEKLKAPLTVAGDQLKAEFTVKKSGNYQLKFTIRGLTVPNAFGSPAIAIIPDKPPEVELLAPLGDLEAMNVQEVKVAFQAGDDFAVERANILLVGETEVRIPLKVSPGVTVGGEASFLPASYQKLGQGAYLSVEVVDNDRVNGPKTGHSRSVYISFYNTGRVLKELNGLLERFKEALLTLLADHLETPQPTDKEVAALGESADNLVKLMESLADLAAKDKENQSLRPAELLNVEASVKAALAKWKGGLALGRQPLIAELEKSILFLHQMMRETNMEEALTLGDELTALQRDLFDRLQRGENMGALQEAVNRIEKMVEEINKKLAQKESLPDDFANSDAVKDAPKDTLQHLMDELREALKAGDRQKAAELAEEILKELQKWLGQLEKAAEGEMDGEASELSRKMDEVSAEVARAIAEEERLLSETRQSQEAASKRTLEELKPKLEAFLQKQRKRLEEADRNATMMDLASKKAPPQEGDPASLELFNKSLEERAKLGRMTNQLYSTLERSLGEAAREVAEMQKKLDAFEGALLPLVKAPEAAAEIQRLKNEARANLGEVAKDLETLLGSRKDRLGEKEKAQVGKLASEQGKLSGDIDKIGSQLEKLAAESPFVDPGAGRKAGSAGKASKAAGKSLGEGNPFTATPSQMETIEKLSELSSDLEKMRENQGGSRKGGRLRGKERPRHQGGKQEVDRSRVEIPGESDSAALKKLREEVMKTMREGRYPEGYREELKRYFEGLIK